MQASLEQLRAKLAALEPAMLRRPEERFELGVPAVDATLGGGLARGALHEIFGGKPADAGSVAGFAATLALRAATGRCVVWVRQALSENESGRLHSPGLSALGFDPATLLLVRARHAADVLRAGNEALRCREVSTVIMEPWGDSRALDFKASRRLSLAAADSGVTCLLLRLAAEPQSSVAATRWQVAAAPSRPLAANAPGFPSFDITLLRQRGGFLGGHWRLEWNHELRVFQHSSPLSGAMASLSPSQPHPKVRERLARTG